MESSQHFLFLKEHGFRPLAGDDASTQPPDIPDVFLHQTAVARARNCFRKHPLSRGGGIDAMRAQFKALLRECAAQINRNYNVDELCRSFPGRLAELAHDTKGERAHAMKMACSCS